jgi:hypothetical protein
MVDCSRVTHPFATGFLMYCYIRKPVRLACLNHAASVHSEPGSNSPKRIRESRILVIHELLDDAGGEACIDSRHRHKARVIWNMLIGGPNQSHKVNFKEPAPRRGKISKKTFGFSAVNTFPEFFRKKCWEGTSVFLPSDPLACIAPRGVDRRDGGKCKPAFAVQELSINFVTLFR